MSLTEKYIKNTLLYQKQKEYLNISTFTNGYDVGWQWYSPPNQTTEFILLENDNLNLKNTFVDSIQIFLLNSHTDILSGKVRIKNLSGEWSENKDFCLNIGEKKMFNFVFNHPINATNLYLNFPFNNCNYLGVRVHKFTPPEPLFIESNLLISSNKEPSCFCSYNKSGSELLRTEAISANPNEKIVKIFHHLPSTLLPAEMDSDGKIVSLKRKIDKIQFFDRNNELIEKVYSYNPTGNQTYSFPQCKFIKQIYTYFSERVNATTETSGTRDLQEENNSYNFIYGNGQYPTLADLLTGQNLAIKTKSKDIEKSAGEKLDATVGSAVRTVMDIAFLDWGKKQDFSLTKKVTFAHNRSPYIIYRFEFENEDIEKLRIDFDVIGYGFSNILHEFKGGIKSYVWTKGDLNSDDIKLISDHWEPFVSEEYSLNYKNLHHFFGSLGNVKRFLFPSHDVFILNLLIVPSHPTIEGHSAYLSGNLNSVIAEISTSTSGSMKGIGLTELRKGVDYFYNPINAPNQIKFNQEKFNFDLDGDGAEENINVILPKSRDVRLVENYLIPEASGANGNTLWEEVTIEGNLYQKAKEDERIFYRNDTNYLFFELTHSAIFVDEEGHNLLGGTKKTFSISDATIGSKTLEQGMLESGGVVEMQNMKYAKIRILNKAKKARCFGLVDWLEKAADLEGKDLGDDNDFPWYHIFSYQQTHPYDNINFVMEPVRNKAGGFPFSFYLYSSIQNTKPTNWNDSSIKWDWVIRMAPFAFVEDSWSYNHGQVPVHNLSPTNDKYYLCFKIKAIKCGDETKTATYYLPFEVRSATNYSDSTWGQGQSAQIQFLISVDPFFIIKYFKDTNANLLFSCDKSLEMDVTDSCSVTLEVENEFLPK